MRLARSSFILLAVAVALVLSATPSSAQHAGFQIGIAPAYNGMVVPGFAQPMGAPFTNYPTPFGFNGVQPPVTVTRGNFVGGGYISGPLGGFAPRGPQVIVGSPVGFPGQVIGAPAIFPGQVYPGQVFPGNVFQGQGYPGQVYPGQVYQGQVYQGQVYQGQVYQGQVYPGQAYPGQAYPGQGFPGGQVVPGQVFVPSAVFTQTPLLQFGPPATSVQLPPIGTPRGEVLKQFGQPRASIVTGSDETLHFDGVTVIIKNGQVVGSR